MTRYQGDLDADADQYAAIAVATPPHRANAAAQVAAPRWRCAAPERIAVPTLVLTSSGDRLCRGAAASASPSGLPPPLRVTRAPAAMPPVTICPSTIQRGFRRRSNERLASRDAPLGAC